MRQSSTRSAAKLGIALVVAAAAACGRGPATVPEADAAGAALAQSPHETTARDVDAMLRALWEKAGIEPAPAVDDGRFLRRAWLDLAGTLPPPEKVTSFLKSRAPNKRHAAIAELMDSPKWAEHWSRIWEGILLGPDVKNPTVDREAFREWVRKRFAANGRYDRFVYDLVTATGHNTSEEESTRVNGAVNWLLRFRDAPEDLAGTASRAFLGVQIQCAQCHDHKTEAWKQADFQRFTACFLRTRATPLGDKMMGKRELEVRDVERPAFLQQGKKKLDTTAFARSKPAALDGTDFSSRDNPRQALASWMTDPKNPWFAKAFVNRVWDRLVGRGFVVPVDDFRKSNPAVAPEILDRLAGDFAEHHFDVRRLVALVCDTEAYQRAAAAPKKGDGSLWSRYPLKPLASDELLDAIVAATGAEALLERVGGDDTEKLRDDLRRQMNFLFDVDEQSDEGGYTGTVPQALSLLNGRLVNGASSAIPGTALQGILAQRGSDAEIIEAIYLRTVSRRPTPDELAHWKAFVKAPRTVVADEGAPPVERRAGAAKGGDKIEKTARVSSLVERKLARADRLNRRETPRQQAFEDVLWALLNSSEFSFNH